MKVVPELLPGLEPAFQWSGGKRAESVGGILGKDLRPKTYVPKLIGKGTETRSFHRSLTAARDIKTGGENASGEGGGSPLRDARKTKRNRKRERSHRSCNRQSDINRSKEMAVTRESEKAETLRFRWGGIRS